MQNTVNYYNLSDDLKEYPDAWLYVVWSKRGAGKTYGALLSALQQKRKIVYIKRTMDDVNLLCSGTMGDFSPYKPINRDTNYNILPKQLRTGIGAFYHADSDGEVFGEPVAYCLALSAVQKYKGFDLSDCDWIVFDECIPQLSETRINKNESSNLLDLYMTIQRDRPLRGKPDLKMILFANAVNISTPITNALNIADDMAEMVNSGIEYLLNDRGMLLHFLPPDKYASSSGKKSKIEESMSDTKWGKMAFGGEFSFNDFSNVKKVSTKNMQPLVEVRYNENTYYIYVNHRQGYFYMTSKKFAKFDLVYDLDTDNGYKSFYRDFVFTLQDRTINGIMSYEKFSMYDLITNYKRYFKV